MSRRWKEKEKVKEVRKTGGGNAGEEKKRKMGENVVMIEGKRWEKMKMKKGKCNKEVLVEDEEEGGE